MLVTERSRDVGRKRASRQTERIVVVPPCEDRPRRERLEQDDEAWLMHYFGRDSGCSDPFWYEFTSQHREMIAAIRSAIVFGGDQSIAASRGEGKTIITERMAMKYALQGVIDYTVIFSSTGAMAEGILDSIKTNLAENDYLLADYPEVCFPVRSLENTPNRAHYQLVSGARHDDGKFYEAHPSNFTWCGQEVIFPDVPGSPSAGFVIATRGLDAAVRGLRKRGKRPKLAIIDDPDTEDSARSEEQAKKIIDRLDRAIAGLGGQQRGIARVVLTTLQSRICASYILTDPHQKPTLKGRRFKFLVAPPERVDLWEEYIHLAKNAYEEFASRNGLDEYAREAHNFYITNRVEMDNGSIIANPNRFNASLLEDGSQVEVSALQRYYNEVARTSPEAVATEYDNDPPEETGAIESGISANKIQHRLSGYDRRVIPPECASIVQGMDIQKAGAHWVVRAYRADATMYTIDYGFTESHGTTYGSDEGVEFSVRRTILDRMEQVKDDPYCTAAGVTVPIALTLVDSGWQAPAVYQACSEIGLGIYPAKGHGKSHGCATPNFYDVLKKTHDRKPGDGWFMQRQPKNIWLVHCDTDRWKSYEHARWLTDEGRPGAASLFGDMTAEERKYLGKRMPRGAKEHHSYAHHLTAEIEVEEVVRGVLKRFWKIKAGRVQNHYLDASYLADVAANMSGIRLLGEAKKNILPPSERPSLSSMAKQR